MHRSQILSLVLVISTGCASSTVIRSHPPGATVRSQTGAVLGKTPYVHSDTQIAGHTERLVVEMAGYEDRQIAVSRDDWNTGRLLGFGIAGLFLWPVWAGLLWAQDYPPEYVVELDPEERAPPPMLP